MKITKSIATALLGFGLVVAPVLPSSPVYAESLTQSAELRGTLADGRLSLAWDLSNNQSSYDLFINGVDVRSGSGDGSLTYELGTEAVAAVYLDLSTPSSSDDPSMETVNVQGFVLSPDQNNGTLTEVANASPSAAQTLVRYATFIQPTYVKAPVFGCNLWGTDHYFRGDNRGFGPLGATYRTRWDILINWSNKSFAQTKQVGVSEIYQLINGTYYIKGSGQASNTGMTFSNGSVTSTIASFHLHHDMTNPLCPLAASIYYDLDFAVYKNGVYTMGGQRRNIPNHELYFRDSDTLLWATGMTQTGTDFSTCLNPLTAGSCTANISVDGMRR